MERAPAAAHPTLVAASRAPISVIPIVGNAVAADGGRASPLRHREYFAGNYTYSCSSGKNLLNCAVLRCGLGKRIGGQAMRSTLPAAIAATFFTFAVSATVAQAQADNTPKKRIENITQYNTVHPSTPTARAPIQYTQPPQKHSDLQIRVPSPPTTGNPNGGWRGPTNPAPLHPSTSTTTYHQPVATSTTTFHAPVVTSTATVRPAAPPPKKP